MPSGSAPASWLLTIVSALALLGAVATSQTLAQQPDRVTIGVVSDGAGPEDEVVPALERELQLHLPRGTTVEFKTDPGFSAAWQAERVPGALRAALADPQVDFVLAIGSMVTREAARAEVTLDKPVISTFVQRADIFGLPYSPDDQSLKQNLSFIVIQHRARRDVREFRELVAFRTLHVLVSSVELQAAPELRGSLEALAAELGIQVAIVPVQPDVDEALSSLGTDVEAAYLTRLPQLSDAERRRLIDGLAERKIPTFSMLGHPDVERGALAGLTPDIGAQVVRRAAINLSRLMRGETTADLPVTMSVDTRLLINARIAAAIDYAPGREIRLFAAFLHPEALEPDRERLSLAETLGLAVAGNTALTVSDAEVESTRLEQFRARSLLLPRLRANLSYNRADSSDLLDDEDATIGGVTLSQQIYSDRFWSSYRSSTSQFESAEWSREVDRLDVMAAAGRTFYDLALAHALYRVEADNLELTEDNLELARLRVDVGYAGREEILRWESAVAQSRSNLFRSAQDVETARIALNQLLGIDQGRRWRPEEAEVDSELFPFVDGRLDPILDDYARLQLLREALVEFALNQSPELLALGKTIEAQHTQVEFLKRRYFLPAFFLDFSWAEKISGTDGNQLILPDDDFYQVSVLATYPIFQGGGRKADLAQARSDQLAIERQQQLARELVEQSTRTALRRAENSFPRIKFTRQAAGTAAENLELVQEKYAEGVVNVTDLLEAQNQKFVSDQITAAAIYEFLGDLVDLQRAIAWFEAEKTTEEQDRFVEEIRSAVAAGGQVPGAAVPTGEARE